MTPLQEKVVKDLKTRVANMRHGSMGDAIISASLISEGWPVGAVRMAMAPRPESPDAGKPWSPEYRPTRCRFRLRDEGRQYPRSSCSACRSTIISGFPAACQNPQKVEDMPMTPVSERGMHE